MTVDISEEELLTKLIEALEERPAFRTRVYAILSEKYTTRDELHEYMERADRKFNELLRETREEREKSDTRYEEMRAESNKRFEAVMNEVKELREESNTRYEEMRADTNKQFEEMRADTTKQFEEMRANTNKRFEAVDKRFDTVDERFEEMKGDIQTMDDRLIGLGARWGLETESAFRNAMEGVLKEHFGANVHKWRVFDKDGVVYNHPADVESDLAICNGKHILIEVKASISDREVRYFYNIGTLYEKLEGVKPELAIVSPFFKPNAIEIAQELGIQVYSV